MSIEEKLEMLGQAKDSLGATVANQRLSKLFDGGSFVEIDSFSKSDGDYTEAVAAYGAVNGCPVYAFAQNRDIQGGAMSKAQAAKLKKLYETATKTGLPIIGIYDSIGAKLVQEYDMLAAYGDILNLTSNVTGVVPQISVVLGPCFGAGAMIAASADIVIMSKKAQLSLETNGKNGTYEENEVGGISHITAEDEADALNKVKDLISMLPSNNLSVSPFADDIGTKKDTSLLNSCADSALNGKDITDEIVACVADDDSFIELQANFGTAVKTGLARIGGNVVGIVAFTGDKTDNDSCTKAARFVRFCDGFSVPIVTFANSDGFTSLRDAAKLTSAYAEATTVKATVVTGKAYGAYYIATAGKGANADITVAWCTAAINALNPVTASVMLWSDRLNNSSDPVADRAKLAIEYRDVEANVFKAAAEGYIEDVIEPAQTREKLITYIDMLSSKRVTTLPRKHGNSQM